MARIYTHRKDCEGNKIYKNDVLHYSFGIPPVYGETKVKHNGKVFYVETPKHNPKIASLFVFLNSVSAYKTKRSS